MIAETIATIILGSLALMALFVTVVILDLILRGISLWKAGRNAQLGWFVCLLIFNTLGILPLVYLLFFQPRKKVVKKRK